MGIRAQGRASRAAVAGVLAVATAAVSLGLGSGRVLASRVAAGRAAAETRAGTGTDAGAAAGRQVLLVNGTRFRAGPGASGLGAAGIIPAARHGLPGSVMSLSLGGHRYEIPAVACPTSVMGWTRACSTSVRC